jgi:hypothetical protein
MPYRGFVAFNGYKASAGPAELTKRWSSARNVSHFNLVAILQLVIGGTWNLPSALAVLSFITSSNLVGRRTGLALLRIGWT